MNIARRGGIGWIPGQVEVKSTFWLQKVLPVHFWKLGQREALLWECVDFLPPRHSPQPTTVPAWLPPHKNTAISDILDLSENLEM